MLFHYELESVNNNLFLGKNYKFCDFNDPTFVPDPVYSFKTIFMFCFAYNLPNLAKNHSSNVYKKTTPELQSKIDNKLVLILPFKYQ